VLRKNVTADDSDGNDWIVTSGLAAGDRIVVSGVQVAAVGAQVTPKPWTTANPDAVAAVAAVNP
jgi:membrane fusion protein (multidrug efflux system)